MNTAPVRIAGNLTGEPMSRKKPTMIGFEIPDQEKKRLADLAAKNGRSVSAEMRIALARHLKPTTKAGGK